MVVLDLQLKRHTTMNARCKRVTSALEMLTCSDSELKLRVGVLTNPSSTEVKNKYANCTSMERLQYPEIKSGINMLWRKRLLLLAYLLKAIHYFSFLFPMHLNLRALERFSWTWNIFNKARTCWKLDFLLHMANALCHLLKRGKLFNVS